MKTEDIVRLTEQLRSANPPKDLSFTVTPFGGNEPIVRTGERAAAFAELVQEIVKVPSVDELSIERGVLAPEELTELFSALAQKDPAVKRLSIWNQLPPESLPALSEYIKNSKRLKELFFNDNSKGEISIDDASLETLSDSIKQNRSLEWFELAKASGSESFYTTVADIIEHNSTISRLSLHSPNNDGHHNAATNVSSFAAALGRNKTLTRLAVTDAHLSGGGLANLATGIEKNGYLTDVELRDNNLAPPDVQAIAQILRNNNTISYMNLNRCNLGDRGATTIGGALPDSALQILTVEDNSVRDQGISAIAQGLESNTSLRRLHAGSEAFRFRDHSSTPNCIGASGARALREMLEANQGLCSLDIVNSYGQNSWEISPIISELAAGLRVNRSLVSLRIDDDFKYGGIGAPGKLLFSPADARTLEQAIIDSSHPTLSEYGYSRIDPSFVESPNMETISSLTRLYDYCAANKAVFVDMINKIRSHPDTLTSGDIVVCKKQMRVILYLAGRDADDIQTTLTRREAEIQRAEALVVRKASNDNVVCDLTEYATHNGLTLDTMQQQIGADNTGTAETFGRLVGGDYTLRDIDTLLALSDGTGQEPFQTALRQFVNHSMIPHLDYFLIQAMKSEDLSQVRSEDFPNIARFGQQPMLEAGIATFSAAPDNPALAATVAQATNELDLSFLHDANAGGIRERLARASSMVDTQVTEFEGIFDGTRERIAEILSQTSDAQDAKQTTGSTLDKARKDNTALREKAAAIAWDIETKERSLATKSTIRTQTSRRIATGQILGGIALKFLPPPIGGGGNNSIVAGLVTLANARAQNRIEKAGHDVETTRMGERAAGYRSQIVSESALEKQISQIEQEIDKLLESRDYQEKYGTAQKLESVRKAYLAKDILDVGQRNSRNLERISQQHGIATLEDLIGAFDGRTAQALTHFCLGYADSNDLSIIIATSNAATPGTTDPARLALHEMVEEHVKDSIAEHYSRAAQVDKAYQANVIGIGTDFYDARQMVQRETDDKLAALMGYQQATQPGLIEGEFNVRGANDIRRVFDFWLHRHGDRMISGVVTGTVGTPKRVTAHPPDRQRSYVETVKQSYGLDGGSVPSVSDDFQRVCAYEYLYHQNINSLGQGENLASDNPQALTMYPVINATINEFIRSMNLTSLEEYRAHVGERLDNLIAQTFIDFFSELGHRHAADVDINTSKAELLAAQTKPELFALAFEDHLKLTECDARNNFPLFLEIYARNLEKMLEVTRGDDREALLQQIDDVHALTQGQLKPDVVMPGSPTALQNALNRNHTYANTGWNAGR